MAKSANNLNAVLQDTADAIKAKKGSNAKICPRDFYDEITNLPSGGSGDITVYGKTTVTGYASVTTKPTILTFGNQDDNLVNLTDKSTFLYTYGADNGIVKNTPSEGDVIYYDAAYRDSDGKTVITLVAVHNEANTNVLVTLDFTNGNVPQVILHNLVHEGSFDSARSLSLQYSLILNLIVAKAYDNGNWRYYHALNLTQIGDMYIEFVGFQGDESDAYDYILNNDKHIGVFDFIGTYIGSIAFSQLSIVVNNSDGGSGSGSAS